MSKRVVIGLVALSLMGLVLVQYQLLRTGLLLEKGKFDQNMRGTLVDLNIAINLSYDTQLMLQRLHQEKERALASPEMLIPKRLQDSLQHFIDSSLSKRGIVLAYEFGLIASAERDTLLVTKGFQRSNYRYEEFTRTLNGQVTSVCACQPILHVHVDHLFNFLLGRLAILIVPSILFLLLLVFCLAWLIRNLNRQRKLDQVKNEFINNLTHELKTPVFSSSLLIKMLRQRLNGKSEKVEEYLQLMEKENTQMKGHIEKVLELASWESGQYELNQHPHPLHLLVEELASRYALKLEESGGSLALRLTAADDSVAMDPVHIMNALQNILENAIKYNPGAVDIVLSTSEKGEYVQIEIQDDGVGIAPEHQKKIFEKFYRIPMGDLHAVKGFGLGLSYVKQIIEAHRGEVSVESRKGKGTKFIILLPKHS